MPTIKSAGAWSSRVLAHRRPVEPRGFSCSMPFLGRLPFADEEDLPTNIFPAILHDHSPPDCSKDFSGFTFVHGMEWSLLLSRQVVLPHLR